MQTQQTLDEFRNEPFTDFSRPENATAMRAAVDKVRGELGREYPIVIDGEKMTLASKFSSFNPGIKTQVVGIFSEGDTDTSLVDKAIEAATDAFKSWRNVDAAVRAEYLFKIAGIMRERKHELSAWMVFEVSKTWAEADGDTAEAIDFCEFYGREMLRWASEQPVTPNPGEKNTFEYIPLGVGAVIPPWNFPLAIMAGMTMAAVVFWTIPGLVAGAYTNDAEVVAMASSLLVIGAFFQLFDGIQTVATGALRGLGDTRTPMFAHVTCYWAIGLPLGWWLTYPLGWGARGFWVGLSLALILIGIILLAAWHRKIGKEEGWS